MLTQIDIPREFSGPVDEDNLLLRLPFVGTSFHDLYILESVTGLNPTDITLFVGDHARDGGSYRGRRTDKRNVVMNITINPQYGFDAAPGDDDVSVLRTRLYSTFLDPRPYVDEFRVRLIDDILPPRYFVGHAEKTENEMFSESTSAQISIICPDPYIKDWDETVIQADPGSGWVLLPLTYSGTTTVGFQIELMVTSATNRVTVDMDSITTDEASSLYDVGRMIFEGMLFQAGDVVKISTTPGNLYANLTRDGVTNSILGYRRPRSTWLTLHPQTAVVMAYGDSPMDGKANITNLTYRAAYRGV